MSHTPTIALPVGSATSTPVPLQPAVIKPAEIARSDLYRITAPDASDEELTELTAGNNAFAFDLYHRLREVDDGGGNLFFSPYSISLALAMAYAGAGGETEKQMAAALRFALPQERLHLAFNGLDLALASGSAPPLTATEGDPVRPELTIANAIWGQQGYDFRSAFLDTLAAQYGAGLGQLDFATETGRQHAAANINDWADDETKGKIPSIVGPDNFAKCTITDPECTLLILTNAIYFKGDWARQCEEGYTGDETFHLLDGSTVEVPLMSLSEEFTYAENDAYRAVQLPYVSDELTMVVLLPRKGEFERFEAGLDGESSTEIIASLSSREVILKLPRFKLETSSSVAGPLQRLGMTDAFDRRNADFSPMVDSPGAGSKDLVIFISGVLPKAFVEVNETGTEAAAVTAVQMTADLECNNCQPRLPWS